MEPIPKSFFSGPVPTQTMSARSAGAENASRIGNTVQQGANLVQDMREEQERQWLTEAEIKMKEASGRIAQDLAKSFDPSEHVNIAKERFQSLESSLLENGKYSRKFREELGRRLKDFKAGRIEAIGFQAGQLQVQNGRKLHTAKVDSALSEGRFDEARALAENGKGLYYGEEDTEISLMEIGYAEKRAQLDSAIAEGNREAIDKLPVSDTDKRQAYRQIEQLERSNTREALDTLTDAVSTGRLTEEEIEEGLEAVPGLSDDKKTLIRQRWQSDQAEKNDREYQAFLKTPAEQNRVTGEVAQSLSSYDPSGTDFDSSYVDIKSQIQKISNKVLRDEYQRKLDGLREGKEREIKNVSDWSFEQIDEMAKAGLLGEAPEVTKSESTLLNFLDDGFLKDSEKLSSLGFDEKQIKEIQKAENADGTADYASQMKVFKALWATRAGVISAEGEELEIGEVIASGKGLTTVLRESDDPDSITANAEQKAAIHRRRGRMEAGLADWLKLNPNADIAKAQEFLEELGVDIETGATNSSWQPSRATNPYSAPADMDASELPPLGGVVEPTWERARGQFKVLDQTRDQIQGFKSKPGERVVSLDFNDADNKSARGIEIKVPDDATPREIQAAQAWARETRAFFAKNGVNVPLRGDNKDGIKRGGRGVSGVFHTEPFFVSHLAAKQAIERDPKGYATILGRTLGNIEGVTFIPPHKTNDPGATGDGFNERDFARKSIIPYLSA